MIGQWTMACLAVHMRVLAGLLFICFIAMAGFACIVPGKFHRIRGDFIDRGCPIMPVLPEGLGNNPVANHQEHNKREYK